MSLDNQPQPIPYIKICQILNQGNPDANGKPQSIYYQEDANGNLLIGNIQGYPLVLEVEVIDWVSENDFTNRGKINAFHPEIVTINSPVANIRQEVYNQLISKYPNLVI